MSTEYQQFTDKPVPVGYWVDAKGALIPEHLIKPIDKERDQLVKELVFHAKKVNEILTEFKKRGFTDIAAFVDLSANEYGVSVGGKKGNVTLYSYDGCYKIQRAMSDKMSFDERIQAAKELIDACLSDWTENARPEIRALINDAFRVDKTGFIRVAEVLKLRKLDIDDERWQNAMTIIGEALQLVGTSSYIRVYERIGGSEKYRPIALDIASAGV
ncbi:TPA: DUF3164 family protein [Citrobacter freundii]|nr:DUF3164 family protein [Kluyvera ascorbata]